MLLYIGAGWDLLLLQNAVQHFGYSHLVCTDALPALDYFEPAQRGYRNSHSLEALLGACRRRLLHLGCTLREEADPAHNLHTFHCSGALQATVQYFYSTPDTAMLDNATLARLLPRVTGLVLHGYEPAPGVLVPSMLPGVRELFLSELSDCDTLPAAREAAPERLTADHYDYTSDDEFEWDPAMLYRSYYAS